jgi:hypothetical protein
LRCPNCPHRWEASCPGNTRPPNPPPPPTYGRPSSRVRGAGAFVTKAIDRAGARVPDSSAATVNAWSMRPTSALVVRAKGPEWHRTVAAFVEAGKGVTPGFLVGEGPEKQMARWGARIVLKELGVRLIRTVLEVEGHSRAEVERMLQALTVAAEESGTRALARSIALVTKRRL